MPARVRIPVEGQDALRTTRALLRTAWHARQLSGFYIPVWEDAKRPPQTQLITSVEQLNQADPFAPVMLHNCALEILKLFQTYPNDRFGLVIRPCELRSLQKLAEKRSLPPREDLTVSMDCLATFPIEDFEWRLGDSEDREDQSRSALHFAAQGGLLPSRYRSNCQICSQPFPIGADMHFELFGVATGENILLSLQSETAIEELRLHSLPIEAVPEERVLRRERVLNRLTSWRQQAQDYTYSHLSAEQKSLNMLIEHLRSCEACAQALEDHCPLFEAHWLSYEADRRRACFDEWICSCGGCGMCAVTCPSDFPLFQAIAYLSKSPHSHKP